jgi:hypothetical protein
MIAAARMIALVAAWSDLRGTSICNLNMSGIGSNIEARHLMEEVRGSSK